MSSWHFICWCNDLKNFYRVISEYDFYRPQRSWGKVIFSEACVNNSVHRGVCVVAWGACVVALGGHAWFYLGGHAWFYFGGHAWFYSAGGGHAWFYSGVHGFIQGGMCGFIQGGMHGFIQQGGCAWFFQFFRIQWDMVNERAVSILLECILVLFVFTKDWKIRGKRKCSRLYASHSLLMLNEDTNFHICSVYCKQEYMQIIEITDFIILRNWWN